MQSKVQTTKKTTTQKLRKKLQFENKNKTEDSSVGSQESCIKFQGCSLYKEVTAPWSGALPTALEMTSSALVHEVIESAGGKGKFDNCNKSEDVVSWK